MNLLDVHSLLFAFFAVPIVLGKKKKNTNLLYHPSLHKKNSKVLDTDLKKNINNNKAR